MDNLNLDTLFQDKSRAKLCYTTPCVNYCTTNFKFEQHMQHRSTVKWNQALENVCIFLTGKLILKFSKLTQTYIIGGYGRPNLPHIVQNFGDF